MEEKTIDIRFYYEGEFKKTVYVGGKTMMVHRVEVDTFSYAVLMEFVKDYLSCTDIGGIYISKGSGGGWHLLSNDADLMKLTENCNDQQEIKFYIDSTVDEGIEPLVQMQPHVKVRPRKNFIQVSPKKVQKRKYVTTHDLQQKHKQKKVGNKTPEVNHRYKLRSSPALLHVHQEANPVKVKERESAAKRKLKLHSDVPESELPPPPPLTDNEKGRISRKQKLQNDVPESELPPPPPLTDYEKGRIAQMLENRKKITELGITNLIVDMQSQTAKTSKSKQQDTLEQESDDYIPEIEDEGDSDDTSERVKKSKKKSLRLRPQTRSQANVSTAAEKEVPAGCSGTVTEKEVTSSVGKILKPTCSKILKSSTNSEVRGSVSAYLALRERQKQGIPPTTPEHVQESNMENNIEEETEAVPHPRKWRGRTKMTTVHARPRDKRPVMFLNKKNVPVSKDRKLNRELSNFLGTLAKDNVSLTYVNWRVVPDQLKKKMWEYTRERYIIPDEAQNWVYHTINRSWRTYKSRMKLRYYTKYATDEERMANRPNSIPLEDFKLLVKYWGDEAVKELALDNKEHRASLNDPHTLGASSSAEVGEKLKNTNPNLASPSSADIYLTAREREDGRTYKTPAVKKRNSKNKSRKESGSCTEDPYLDDLTAKIRGGLEAELEEKVNKKVQDKLSIVLKKLADANPSLNMDFGEFCAIASSEDDETGTPFTSATVGTAGTSGMST